ncbi:CLUMA_CG015178, isoform A [Clunio marinus]|uniref:CLUMA_CG015178, isoform A n=1 Tax=Clunio marinus TaxID=568069 RepID=A0A1J1ITB7_9DIPT|nr:CLUMA_CG015178, isoform A [Clunio marinus]
MRCFIFVILPFSLIFVSYSNALNVNCDFKSSSIEIYGPLKTPYQCAARDQQVQGFGSVDSVLGTHLAGKTNNDTRLINIKKIKCDRMPKNFNKYFPNLEGIFAFSTGMKTVKKEDLDVFPKLRYLDMSNNKIDTLASNLFEGNTELEWIDFADNYLRNIGINLLTPLTKLNYADFQSNRCVDKRARDKTTLYELQLELRKLQCALNDA